MGGALVAAVLVALTLPAPVAAQPRELAARVVWAQAGRAYLAASDSGVFEPGMLITLFDRRRVAATGEITGVLDGTLASAWLTSGSLDRVKRLDRLRVMAERPPTRARPILRVGCPGDARANLAVACAAASVEFPFVPGGYRVERLGRDGYRGVRLTRTGPAAHWPDTLFVRRFGDAADEEIALERGELDVAVFWPGELSARLRNDPRGRDALLGLRAHGVIAAVDAAAVSGSDPEAARRDAGLASINAELFGGDLQPWAAVDTAAATPATERTRPSARPYSVDLSLPGHTPIEHFLNGGATLFMRGKSVPLRVTYLEVALGARDSLAGEWRARGISPLFALRCPVLCAPAVRDYVRSLGADAFANLMVCAPAPRRP
ncbi:MAG: hypothetical protein ABIS67_03255 [Candidatus Eisenbacteria bacterium]